MAVLAIKSVLLRESEKGDASYGVMLESWKVLAWVTAADCLDIVGEDEVGAILPMKAPFDGKPAADKADVFPLLPRRMFRDEIEALRAGFAQFVAAY